MDRDAELMTISQVLRSEEANMAAGTESRPTDSTGKPPKDDTIAQLSRIWQDLLGLDSVEPDQNYFDLGGDSLLAVQMFAQIEKSFNVNLPLATLFDAPTIEELAQILRQECATPKWSPVVPIQTSGTKPPLFCMHGARGNVLMYRGLSQHLGDDQPFYGLQCQGLDGSCLPFTRVEDMAALYVKEIRKVQPKGPYFLGGYCLGGTIALEMAQQLVASGERVAMLALFDTMNWSRLAYSTGLANVLSPRAAAGLSRREFSWLEFFRQTPLFSGETSGLAAAASPCGEAKFSTSFTVDRRWVDPNPLSWAGSGAQTILPASTTSQNLIPESLQIFVRLNSTACSADPSSSGVP